MIVEKQAGANHPFWPQMFDMRHDKTQRPNDVRRNVEQHFALL